MGNANATTNNIVEKEDNLMIIVQQSKSSSKKLHGRPTTTASKTFNASDMDKEAIAQNFQILNANVFREINSLKKIP